MRAKMDENPVILFCKVYGATCYVYKQLKIFRIGMMEKTTVVVHALDYHSRKKAGRMLTNVACWRAKIFCFSWKLYVVADKGVEVKITVYEFKKIYSL